MSIIWFFKIKYNPKHVYILRCNRFIRVSACLIFLCLFFGVELKADELIISYQKNIVRQSIVFDRFKSQDGLPDNRIRSIYQDNAGFLWIGTMNGLCKYDGYTFANYYKTPNSNSISGNWCLAVCEDSLQHIWIGTLDGLNCFDIQKETFTNYRQDSIDQNSLLSNEINALLCDKYGNLWIGTTKGITKFDVREKKFTRINNYPFNNIIEKIINSYGDFIWIATYDGVIHYNVVTGKYAFYKINARSTTFGDKFWALLEYNRNLYIATGRDGLFILPWNQEKMNYDQPVQFNNFQGNIENFENTQIFDICKSDKGDIWLGTEKGLAKIEGINTLSPRLVFYKNNPADDRSISNDFVYKVFIDRTNVLWCGTELGLNKTDLNLLPFRYYTFTDQHFKDQIRNIFSKNGRDIWFGTARKGFYHYNIQTGTWYYHFNPSSSPLNSTRAILEEQNNKLWLGTLGGAVIINGRQKYRKETDGATYAYLKDSKANIWIGTNNGLYRILADGTKRLYLHHTDDRYRNRPEFLRTLYEDHQGNIWCGFENSGVFCLDPETGIFTKIFEDQNGNKILGSMIYSILEYPRNVIWIGSESGLNKVVFEDNHRYNIKNYSEKDGLSDKSISGIQTDYRDNLWIGTIKGLMRFNITNETFEYYLTDFCFSTSCIAQTEYNSLLMGTDAGFIIFNPNDIVMNEYKPNVIITDFKLLNKSITVGERINNDVILQESISKTSKIVLNYKNNVFSLIFTALHFSDPQKNRYAYKLNGFDNDWIQTDADNRMASYTNLNPGTYVFMVKAANNSGVWTAKPLELKIVILPPPWKTWWAFTIYILFFLSLCYFIVRYYFTQIKQRHQIEFERYEKDQLQKLNYVKLKFFTDIAHEFRTPLMLIIGPVKELLKYTNELPEAVRRKIDIVQRNCEKLNYLIDELMTFRKIDQNKLSIHVEEIDIVSYGREIFLNFQPLAEQKNIIFSFSSDIQICPIWADPKCLEKIFNNLLSNAFKFTKDNDTVQLKISLPEVTDNLLLTQYVCIEVEDNGRGISSKDIDKIFDRFYQADSNMTGTGVGLSLVKSLVELHQGKLTVESELGRFTRFKVFFHLGSEYVDENQKQTMTSPIIHPNPDIPLLLVDSQSNHHLDNHNEIKEYYLLIVDDNPEVLDFLESIFEEKYHLQLAKNGEEALCQIEKHEPDLIISDMMMPVMDGIELCRRIKANLVTCHIPFILLTAKSSVENEIEGMAEGVDDYIAKPFNPDILRARVSNLIEFRKKMIEKIKAGNMDNLRYIAKNKVDQEFIQKLLNHVIENITCLDFDVEKLSSLVGMSRSNLFRKLKTVTGQTPVEFISSVRMKYSLELLIEQKLNISEIAFKIGFENISSFSRAFKNLYGMPPSDYLQSLEKNVAKVN